jgi:hypothetical protein
MTLKIAVFAPIPSASESSATSVKPGLFHEHPQAVQKVFWHIE